MIYNKIKLLRVQKFLSQKYVAEKLFISQSAYCKLEKGITKLDYDRIIQLTQILGTDISSLMSSEKRM